MFRVYRSTARFQWPIAVASLVGTLAFDSWIDPGDRVGMAQPAVYLSLVLVNITTFFLGSVMVRRWWQFWQNPPTVGRDELLAAIRQEVTERVQQSLHYAVLNQLRLNDYSESSIPRLWNVEIKRGNKPSRTIQPTENILDAFPDTSSLGRVLILGMQGSGKTTLLLELADNLCDRAEDNPNLPVPVLLDLPNWQPAQTLPSWIVSELQAKYGVARELSQQWLQTGVVFLLFDGLDELERAQQEMCVIALNDLRLSDGRSQPFVVCTRMSSYKQIDRPLKFSTAIGLKHLTLEQIEHYLLLSRSRELWENIKDDTDLLALAKNPLFLNIMTLAYEEILIHAWKRLTTKKDRIEYLFNAYLRNQLGRQIASQSDRAKQQPTPDQIKHWLKWLAHTMTQEHQIEFSLESQPFAALDNTSQFMALGIIWSLVCVYTSIFFTFYTLKIGIFYAIFFLIAAWGFVASLAVKTRSMTDLSGWQKKCTMLTLNTMILFGLGLLSFQINSLLIEQANVQTGALLYVLSIVIFTVAIAPVVGLTFIICSALPWLKPLSLRLSLWRHGEIPWNYGRFLKCLTDRLFMQKVRDRYRLIHPLFVRHLLTLDR